MGYFYKWSAEGGTKTRFLILDILFFITVLTSAFDLILNLKLYVFTVRLAHFTALAFIALVFLTAHENKSWRIKNPVIYPMVAYLAVAALSLFRSYFILKSAGYFCWALFDFALFMAVAIYACNCTNQARLTGIFLTAYILVCSFGLAQLYAGILFGKSLLVTQWMGDVPRINAFFYEPSYFAFFAVQGLSVAGAVLFLKKRFSYFYFTAVVLIGTSLVFSSSRSGLIALAILFLLLAFMSLKKGTFPRYALTLLTLFTVVSINFAPALLKKDLYLRMWRSGVDMNEVSSSHPRIMTLKQGISVFSEAPLLGVGVGGYGGYVVAHPGLLLPDQEANPATITTTNLYIEVLAETGVLGLGALLLILFTVFYNGYKALRTGSENTEYLTGYLAAAFLIFGISYQFCQTLFRLDVYILLGVLSGLIIRTLQPARTQTIHP